MVKRRSKACSKRTLRIGERRSTIAASFAKERSKRSADDVADCRSFGRRACANGIDETWLKLERYRSRWLDDGHRSPEVPSLLDIPIGLTT
jgi:hypothetical protein